MSDEPIGIVALGGTSQSGSSTEKALRLAIRGAEAAGARVTHYDGAFLTHLPHYGTKPLEDLPQARGFIDCIRRADGLLIASPGWHGSVSGLVKNAIDYLEETATDARAYLDGLPVGLIVTAYGWQATGSTLMTLRAVVHALRGWPTPLGAAVNCSGGLFRDGVCTDDGVSRLLDTVGRQVAGFANTQRLATLGRGAN